MGRASVQPAPDGTAGSGCTVGTGGWGSSHPGRFQCVLADGSVRGINYGILTTTLTNLANINDGATIDFSSF